MRKIKKIPPFKNEDDERKFWASHSPLDYVSHTQQVTLGQLIEGNPGLLSLRLPPKMRAALEAVAKEKQVACHSLIKTWLSEKLKEEKSNKYAA